MNDFARIFTVLTLLLIVAVSVYRYTLNKNIDIKNKENMILSNKDDKSGIDNTEVSENKLADINEITDENGSVAGQSDSNPSDFEGISSESETQVSNETETSKVNNLEGDNMAKVLSSDDKLRFPGPESMSIKEGYDYNAILKTDAGNIKIKLHSDKVPVTANNFVYLSRNNFYNDVIFHRVIENFMIQTGDPLGNGMGGPNYRFNDEQFEGEYKRGVVAMANSGLNTNGSQFFIMHKDVTSLPKNYVIFGEVTEGFDTLDKIAMAEVKEGAMGEISTPVSPFKIESVEIIEEPTAE